MLGLSAQSGPESKNARTAASQNKDILAAPAYTVRWLANGPAGDGTQLSVRVYMSSEGTEVTTAHGHFKSRAAAKAELERQTKQDGKILERVSRINSSGTVVGERAIVRLAATKLLPEHSSIFLTDGRDYYEISSSSMELALDMAKRYYNLLLK
jgi:hypothetical protein